MLLWNYIRNGWFPTEKLCLEEKALAYFICLSLAACSTMTFLRTELKWLMKRFEWIICKIIFPLFILTLAWRHQNRRVWNRVFPNSLPQSTDARSSVISQQYAITLQHHDVTAVLLVTDRLPTATSSHPDGFSQKKWELWHVTATRSSGLSSRNDATGCSYVATSGDVKSANWFCASTANRRCSCWYSSQKNAARKFPRVLRWFVTTYM